MPNPLRVLHLEDSPRDADVIRHKLDAEGVTCDITLVTTKDAFEGALTRELIDLVLCDYNLPGYDGVTALTYAQQVRPDVPVILISGTVGDEEAVRCLQLGATDYLLKDRLERLGSAVKRALQEAESRRTRVSADAQRERLAALVDASPDFIGYADPKTTQILYINKGGRRMCGIGEDEDIGTLKLDDVHPAWMNQRLTEAVLPAAVRDSVWQGDGAFLHRDGHEIPVSMALLAHRGTDGDVDFFYTVSRDITERKRAEVALRDEHDRAQRFLDRAEVILLKLNVDGRIVLVNRYGCSILGWPADELLGRDWFDTCIPAPVRDVVRKLFHQVPGGDPSIVETAILTRSGDERLIEWRSSLMTDSEGRVIGTFSSGTDITERSQATAALRAAEERMRFALKAANIGIWDMDVPMGRVQWSEILEGQYGLTPGTFGGTFEAFVECIHPDDRTSVLETVGNAMKAGADFSVLNRSIWPDGTVRWLSGAGRVFLGKHGEPVRAVGISQDVTARVQADETRARLAAIVDSTDDAIYSTTLEDTVLTWNAGAERLYGYTAAEVIGRNRSLIVPAGASVGLTAAMLEKAGRGEAGEPFETKRVRKGGSMIDVSLMISPITDSTGRVTGASSIARDIGNRKKAEAELQRLNDEIQLQRMRVFKATIRTVQDIVNNLLNSFLLVRLEGEGHLPAGLLTLVDQMVQEAGAKLKTLGDLEAVNEKEMAIGTGIDYPGAGS